ncbi:MAG: ubiquinone/menaquinone biosynthesis methyltransferase [Candidatus Omnitrophica bacterium]|nr:ubiquinone/menaquinone biosynthesis methyltransferase [Candidatus Omnitrophota bacterium]
MRETGGSKRLFVHRLFTTIAPRYDWFNRIASLGMDRSWRRLALKAGGLAQGMDVLDVCTGTGDLAFLCAAQLNGSGRIVGLDFNETMLRCAVQKPSARPHAITWLRGDAQVLPFASGRFDRVVIGFSTRNLSDLKAGICEMGRVLKPRGRLVVLETGRPSNPLVLAGYLVFLGTAARLIGLCLTGRLWPFTYLARSVRQFLAPLEFVALLNACGLAATHRPLAFGLASLYIAEKPAVRP